MAEGILQASACDPIEVHSAGAKPAGYVDPKAIQVLKEIGIDISDHTSKDMNTFLDRQIETVITDSLHTEKPISRAPSFSGR
jgi:arsenate reductase